MRTGRYWKRISKGALKNKLTFLDADTSRPAVLLHNITPRVGYQKKSGQDPSCNEFDGSRGFLMMLTSRTVGIICGLDNESWAFGVYSYYFLSVDFSLLL